MGADDGAGDAGAAWRTQGGTTTRRASAGAAGNASDGQQTQEPQRRTRRSFQVAGGRGVLGCVRDTRRLVSARKGL